LNGFIGAPGVITVVYPMVVNVTLLTLLLVLLPLDEPDDEHAATSAADVATASEIERNLSLRLFTGHLLDPLMQEG
jgi:hypothetical protein